MIFNVDSLLYGYVFICIALLLFNLYYIFRSKARKNRRKILRQNWIRQIQCQMEEMKKIGDISPDYTKKMVKELKVTNSLIAYSEALAALKMEPAKFLDTYILKTFAAVQQLGLYYRRRDNMDKAYFAYFISLYPPCTKENDHLLIEILLSYIDESTVFCRENVMTALCTLGSVQAVERLLDIFSSRGIFHHQKLLSDGLLAFAGDKEELAAGLWKHRREWNTDIVQSVVQFITGFSGQYQKAFFSYLEKAEGDVEIRLSMLRYFRRYPYEPVRPLLYEYLESEERYDVNFCIVAASVLDQYPGGKTVEVLKQALHHSNWYVRYNSANTLTLLKQNTKDLRDILEGQDRYAKEMLSYKMEEAKST